MMPMLKRLLVVGLLGLVGWIGVPGSVHAAVTCQVTSPGTLTFGTLTLPLNSNTAVATISVRCQKTSNTPASALMCIGTEDNVSPRTMTRATAPAATLSFDMYADAAYSRILNYANNASVTIDMPAANNWYTGVITIYGKLVANQLSTAPGNYSVAILNAAYGWDTGNGASCSNIQPAGDFTINATATLQGSCTISASPLNFGTQTSLAANIDAQTSLTITCTNGTPYTVKLDGGTAAAFNPRKLYLNGSGPQTVNYNLYTDTGRTTVWGIGGGSGSTQTGNGTGNGQGNPQTLVVYGRVPAQAGGWTAGTYKDTVTATVEF